MDEVRLWNGEAEETPEYRSLVLEQYRIYVEMADRIGTRRSAANTFFLTINSAVFTLFGVFWAGKPTSGEWWLAFPLLALITQCAAWFYLVRSYRQLSKAKYQVVGMLEERLPASPYWNAEWAALKQGADRKTYWPLTHLEQWVPISFGVLYVMGFVAAMLA